MGRSVSLETHHKVILKKLPVFFKSCGKIISYLRRVVGPFLRVLLLFTSVCF